MTRKREISEVVKSFSCCAKVTYKYASVRAARKLAMGVAPKEAWGRVRQVSLPLLSGLPGSSRKI